MRTCDVLVHHFRKMMLYVYDPRLRTLIISPMTFTFHFIEAAAMILRNNI